MGTDLTVAEQSRAVADEPTGGPQCLLFLQRNPAGTVMQVPMASPGSHASTVFTEKVQGSKEQTRLMKTFIMLLTPFLTLVMKQRLTPCCGWKKGIWTPFSQLHSKALYAMRKK